MALRHDTSCRSAPFRVAGDAGEHRDAVANRVRALSVRLMTPIVPPSRATA